jgi:hypothetical protein
MVEQKIRVIPDGEPTLERAILVLEAAGFRVWDVEYRPQFISGKNMSETLKVGIIRMSVSAGRRPETAPTLAEEALHE